MDDPDLETTNDPLAIILLAVLDLASSILPAATGFGGAVVLLPVLVAIFGMRDNVPILTVAQVCGNTSLVCFNRKDIAWPVVGWFALGSVPTGFAGPSCSYKPRSRSSPAFSEFSCRWWSSTGTPEGRANAA